MNQLEGIGLSRSFGEVVAVREVDIDVAEREVVGLVGANGAGKTTLIRLLLGLLQPSAGTVGLFGAPPRRARHALASGTCRSSGGLYDDLTVAENLDFEHAAYGGMGSADLPDDLAAAAESSGRGPLARPAAARRLRHRSVARAGAAGAR